MTCSSSRATMRGSSAASSISSRRGPGRPRRSPHAPLALSGLALSLFAGPVSRGLLELPSCSDAIGSLSPFCLDPGDLLEHARLPYAQSHRLGHLGRPGQVRIGALDVLLQGREGFSELLPLRAFHSPLAHDGVQILALFSVHVDQRARVTGRLLRGVRQALGLAAALQGSPDSGDPIPRDLVRALLPIRRNPALPCLDLGDPLGMSPELVVVALAHVLPLAGERGRCRDEREQKAGDEGAGASCPGAAVTHRQPHLRLPTLPWIASSRFASSLSWPARFSES